MTRMRTALIGCGKVGHIHARALRALPESDFVAACDASLDRAENLAAPWGARPFADLARMLEAARPEVVILATPPHVRPDLARAAFANGLHVLCEKPLANGPRQCRGMIEQARAAGRTLAVATVGRDVESLRAELRPGGVRMVNVFFGPLDTEWFQTVPPPKVAPANLAHAVIDALKSGLEDVFVGDVAEDVRARLAVNPKALERELASEAAVRREALEQDLAAARRDNEAVAERSRGARGLHAAFAVRINSAKITVT